MSSEFGQSSLEIVPPIIWNEDADIQAYPSVEAAIGDIEVIDILNEEYEFHDSTGRVLEARLDGKRVSLVPTSTLEANSETLRGYILGMLRLHGVVVEGLSAKPFSELAQLLLEKSTSK